MLVIRRLIASSADGEGPEIPSLASGSRGFVCWRLELWTEDGAGVLAVTGVETAENWRPPRPPRDERMLWTVAMMPGPRGVALEGGN